MGRWASEQNVDGRMDWILLIVVTIEVASVIDGRGSRTLAVGL